MDRTGGWKRLPAVSWSTWQSGSSCTARVGSEVVRGVVSVNAEDVLNVDILTYRVLYVIHNVEQKSVHANHTGEVHIFSMKFYLCLIMSLLMY